MPAAKLSLATVLIAWNTPSQARCRVSCTKRDGPGKRSRFARFSVQLSAAESEDTRPEAGCATLFCKGDPMTAPARAKEPRVKNLALEEMIRRRAYELYVLRGNESGSELDDWLQAEAAHLRSYAEAFDES